MIEELEDLYDLEEEYPRPKLKRRIKFMNVDTYDFMDVTICGYYVEDFTREIKKVLKVVTSHGRTNKWKIVQEEKIPSNGVKAKW